MKKNNNPKKLLSYMILFLFFTNYNCFGAIKIIIKFDDMNVLKDRVWGKNAMDYMVKKTIKFSSGVIANRLDDTALNTLSPYLLAIDSEGNKLFEVWHHGYDHVIPEFSVHPYTYQSQHFNDADRIVNNLLQVQMNSFGTPGNSSDSITNQVISENPNYHIFMLSQVLPKKFDKSILYLNQRVEMENGVGNVNYDYFVANFNKYKNRFTDYMIIQGHPNDWDTDKNQQFQQIIEFLIAQGVEFVLPYEYYCDTMLKEPIRLSVEIITPKQTKMTWIDKNDIALLNYNIERSVDSIVWKSVCANFKNTSNSSFTMSYVDEDIQAKNGICFYRVKPTGGDKTCISNVVKVIGLDSDIGLMNILKQNKIELQVFPNPCSEYAFLKYKLSIAGVVKGIIYNLDGNLIKKLFCESQFSGFNQFLIDVSDLNPGIYF